MLVNERDEAIGVEEKLQAHRTPALHRAFSVFVVNPSGHLLLQRRAATKYHSAGLWANTACGHPRPGESTAEAAARRLFEEMGIQCALTHVGSFVYRVAVSDTLTEHEFDHVFIGQSGADPQPDPLEVEAWAWRSRSDIDEDLVASADKFAPWFRHAWQMIRESLPAAL